MIIFAKHFIFVSQGICFDKTKQNSGVRGSHPEVLCKNLFFAKFTEKQLFERIFLNKVACLSPATLLKKRLWHRCFPMNFAKFLGTPILTERLWWLLLWCVVTYFTKHEDCNLCKFNFKFSFIFTLLPCREAFKTHFFHFKLIHSCSWIHIILLCHYLPVHSHHNF